MESRRDEWLRLDDEALARDCTVRRFKGGGPGGQRRNKVQTGVVLEHLPTGIVSRASESRSGAVNRARALRRLRERIAAEVRDGLPERLPAELLSRRTADGRLRVASGHRDFPLVAAVVLDALAAADGRFAGAGRLLGLTTSQVIRLLESAPWLRRAARRWTARR
jgi:hypothetical protein